MYTFRSLISAALVLALPTAQAIQINATALWTHATGVFDDSAAEIVTHDAATQRVFVVNGHDKRIDVLDANDGTFLGMLDVSSMGSPNSVAAKNGVIAVAVENTDPQANGSLVFFDANDGSIAGGGTSTGSVEVGPMPDMVAFLSDGSKVIVANEGEPDFYGAGGTDPEGSVTIVDVAGQSVDSTAVFTGFNKTDLVAAGVRITGPNASAAQDIEPEYITVSSDGSKAYVTLQENNAIAEVDIATGTVSAIRALGTKDHDVSGNGLDASDRDGAINIEKWPVSGMYMPDSIASYEVGGNTYLVTANEGDGREYDNPNDSNDDYTDEDRVKDLTLDPGVFTDPTLQDDDNLGRLTVSRVAFDGTVPINYDELFGFGSRSFSIWDAATGSQVFDSGDDFEQITAALGLQDQGGNPVFNSNNDDNDSFDNRSDNKGPEPEALALGQINGYVLAFIGLERIGGIMIYDITDPTSPEFLDYLLDRDFTAAANTTPAGDLGPEGMYFLTADLSPTGNYGLLVANEVSGTTTYYDVTVPVPAPVVLFAACLPLLLLRRGRRLVDTSSQ